MDSFSNNTRSLFIYLFLYYVWYNSGCQWDFHQSYSTFDNKSIQILILILNFNSQHIQTLTAHLLKPLIFISNLTLTKLRSMCVCVFMCVSACVWSTGRSASGTGSLTHMVTFPEGVNSVTPHPHTGRVREQPVNGNEAQVNVVRSTDCVCVCVWLKQRIVRKNDWNLKNVVFDVKVKFCWPASVPVNRDCEFF